MKGFFDELKQRRVYRVAIGYIIVASATVQLFGTVLPIFHAEDWVQQLFVALVALGFPVALVLGWVFEIQPGGLKRTSSAEGNQSTDFRRMTVLAATGLLLALVALAGYWIWHPWRNATHPLPNATSPLDAAHQIPEKSIAVLPFENLSDNKENAYFAEGVHDEILTDLAKVADLKVISRTSTMQYRAGAERNLRDIGKALGTAYLVEGTVQRTGNRVRVNVQLIDGRTDIHVWAEQYDRDLADIFAIQSEISEEVVSELKAKLSPVEKAAIEERPTGDLVAYDLYLRARALIARMVFDASQMENLVEASHLLEQATTRDPLFFQAYCQLANAHDQIYFYGIDHTPERLARANVALQKAIALRPNTGEAHLAAAGHYYFGYHDYDHAREELVLARKFLPNDPFPVLLMGYIDRRQGRWDQSIRHLERALELDPRNLLFLKQLALTYNNLRRYNDMAALLDRALSLAPDDSGLQVQRAAVDLEARATTKPMHEVIETILADDPGAGANFADQWLRLALCERDPDAAEKAMAMMTASGCHFEGVPFPRSWCKGLIARERNDPEGARQAFSEARTEVQSIVSQQPDFAEGLAALAMIDAALGDKDNAVREGQRAVELLPIARDAITGPILVEYLAVAYAWTGDKTKAIEQLRIATSAPSYLSYGQLKLYPYWDPLRGDPEFEKILASLAPN